MKRAEMEAALKAHYLRTGQNITLLRLAPKADLEELMRHNDLMPPKEDASEADEEMEVSSMRTKKGMKKYEAKMKKVKGKVDLYQMRNDIDEMIKQLEANKKKEMR